MSVYLEIPQLDPQFPYRSFLNDGMTVTYPHWHKEIEIIYVSRGKVRIGLEDQLIELVEGEALLIASGEAHYFLASPDSERYVYQFDVKLFDESYLRGDKESLLQLFAKREPHSEHWPEPVRRQLLNLLVEMFHFNETEILAKKYFILGNLYRLIGEMYEHLPERQFLRVKETPRAVHRRETLERLNEVFEYIENHYQETMSLEDVARYVGFSPYYFTRFFKKNTGQTFLQFLTEYRINQAKFILANERLPMAEIAERSGFPSVKTFHHNFKDVVGISPLQYQKQLLEINE